MEAVFLHGLNSSSMGKKARWFSAHFPIMRIPDFSGSFAERMEKLNLILAGKNDLVLIGSSFGGLMATSYVQKHESSVHRVVLLAPALNFPEFMSCIDHRVDVPAELYIGQQDSVCPPAEVVPLAREIFANISVHVTDDDHLLHKTFEKISWSHILEDQDNDVT